MSKHVKILLLGLLISFLGTLPFGTLNMTAFHIAAAQSEDKAIVFAIGVVIVEMIVVRITLSGARRINFKDKFAFYLLPFAIGLLLYLSVSSFMSSGNQNPIGSGANLFPMIQSSFLLGLLLSALNPMHVPFWLGWNSVLFEKKALNNKRGMYASYIVGIGTGTVAGLMVFIFAGTYIFRNYHQYNYAISFVMGCLYLIFTLYLLYLPFKKRLKLNIL